MLLCCAVLAVAYLLVFHVCFVMFSWTYWKSIFTPPASPCKKVALMFSLPLILQLFIKVLIALRACHIVCHWWMDLFVWFTLCLWLFPQFQLSYSDKERYEMEERPDAQKQILAEIAKKLPIFSRAQSGGKWIVFFRMKSCDIIINSQQWCYKCIV